MSLGFLCCFKPEEPKEEEMLLATAAISNNKMSSRVQIAVNIFSMYILSLVNQNAWEFPVFIVCICYWLLSREFQDRAIALLQQNEKKSLQCPNPGQDVNEPS